MSLGQHQHQNSWDIALARFDLSEHLGTLGQAKGKQGKKKASHTIQAFDEVWQPTDRLHP